MDREVLIGTTLHIGCMIERLKKGDSVIGFKGKEEYIKANPQLYKAVKSACIKLNEKYDIYILSDEICYIMSYFKMGN